MVMVRKCGALSQEVDYYFYVGKNGDNLNSSCKEGRRHMENKFWFKRKKYGWGWRPASYEGWAVTLAVFGYIVFYHLL